MSEDRKSVDPEMMNIDKEFNDLCVIKEKLMEYFNNNINNWGSYDLQGHAIGAASAIAQITREQRELLKLK